MSNRIKKGEKGIRTAMKHIAAWCLALIAVAAVGVPSAHAQLGALYGGQLYLTNGTNSITLKDTSISFSNYTLTLPSAQSTSGSTQWLSIGASSSALSWASTGITGSAVTFSPTAPEQFASSSNYLFNLQALSPTGNNNGASAVNAPTPGALINSTTTGSSSNATGLTIDVANALNTATGVSELGAEFYAKNAGNSSSVSVNVGLIANASGHGTNYAALFTNGSVGIGTTTPEEALDVNGNIRISGVNGLRITEGTNATMGVATLALGTATVNTSKVTNNSCIFLMVQAPLGLTVGTPYISARNAGNSFTITSTGGVTDLSTVAWWIVEPE